MAADSEGGKLRRAELGVSSCGCAGPSALGILWGFTQGCVCDGRSRVLHALHPGLV